MASPLSIWFLNEPFGRYPQYRQDWLKQRFDYRVMNIAENINNLLQKSVLLFSVD